MRDAAAICGAPLTAPDRDNPGYFRTSDATVDRMGPSPVVTTFGFPFMARRAGGTKHLLWGCDVCRQLLDKIVFLQMQEQTYPDAESRDADCDRVGLMQFLDHAAA